MPAATDAVWISVLPDMSKFGSTLARDAARDGDAAGKRAGGAYTGGFGASIKKLAAMAGGALAGIGLTSFFKDSVGAASDLSETMNKATVIFGDQAGAMRKWAQDSAQSFGLSRAQALEAAAGFGNMFSQLGFAGDQAASMSQQVVQLSTDLGSFNNLPTAEVADMMSAAFRGEYDSLQRLIPNINAARVEQEALAMTGKSTAKELTAAEKATAVLAIVQRDGAAAAGDFAETSDGLANSQKILSAQFDDAKAALGERLLPAVTTAVQWLGERLPGAVDTAGVVFDRLGAAIGAVANFISEHKTLVIGLTTVMGALVAVTQLHAAVLAVQAAGGLAAYIAQTRIVQAVTKTWTAVQWLLNAALTANPIGIVIAALVALGAGLVIAYQKSETFREIVQRAWQGVKDVAAAVVDWFQRTAWPTLKSVWDAVAAAATWLWRNVLQPAWTGIQAGWQVMSALMKKAWDTVLKPTWDVIASVVKWLWNSVLAVAFLGIRVQWEVMTSLIKAAWDRVLKPTWDAIAAAARWLWNNLLKPTFDAIQRAWNLLLVAFRTYWTSILKPTWDAVANAARWLWNNMLKPAFDAIRAGWSALSSGISSVWRSGISPIFTAVSNGIAAVKRAFDTARAGIAAAWNGIRDAAKVPIRFVVNTVINGAIIDNFNKIARFFGARQIGRVSLPAGFAEGGPVYGPGTGTSDSIMARLSNGEFVVRAQQARKWGPVLEQINTPGFAIGGWVGDAWEGIKGAASGVLGFLRDPASALRGLVDRALGGIGNSGLAQMASRIPGKILDSVVSKIRSVIDSAAAASQGGSAAGLTGTAAALRQAILNVFGPMTIGGYSRRNIYGSNKLSDHALGKALDVMTTNVGLGNAIRDFMLAWPSIKYVIWRQRIYYPGRGGRLMEDRGSATQNHYDHVHGSVYDKGGWLMPGQFALNLSRKPEAVFNQQQLAALTSPRADGPVTLSSDSVNAIAEVVLAGAGQVVNRQAALAQSLLRQGASR